MKRTSARQGRALRLLRGGGRPTSVGGASSKRAAPRMDQQPGRETGALPTPRAYYSRTIEGLRERHAGWASGRCPFHPDRHPSLSVNLETGAYRCHAAHCAVSGSNVVSFVSSLMGMSHREAVAYLKKHHGNDA